MTHGYISVEQIIDKYLTDTGIKDTTIDISDYVQWISEGLKRIGAYPQFITRVTGIRDNYGYEDILTISNYQTILPCDCYYPISVAVSTDKWANYSVCRRDTGLFDIRQVSQIVSPLSQGSTTEPFPNIMQDKLQFVADLYNETISQAGTRLNSDTHLNEVLDQVFLTDGSVIASGSYYDLAYIYEYPYLRFQLSDGYCMVSYKAIPTDENGYPYVPDDEMVKEALKWFIEMNMLYREFRKHIEGTKELYLHAKMEWEKKRIAAYGDMMMPHGVDDLKAIQNIWLRLIPGINEHYTGYKNTGAVQRLYNRH